MLCVCCNRCLYKRSGILFDEEKYKKNSFHADFHPVLSFDKTNYICKTCDRKLQKQEIPCQSVSNKLQLFYLPTHFQDLNKFERIIISQRILFAKVSIMPKGQFPKIKGTICNIPVETEGVCNVLPRNINDSGVL